MEEKNGQKFAIERADCNVRRIRTGKDFEGHPVRLDVFLWSSAPVVGFAEKVKVGGRIK